MASGLDVFKRDVFKEFFPKDAAKVDSRGGSSLSPKEPPRFPLDEDDSSPLEWLGVNLGFQEPFPPDQTVVSSVLEDEDWSSSYQTSMVEEGHSCTSTSSPFDSFYSNPSEWSDL